jgi:AAA family ATP:ADP antiporter
MVYINQSEYGAVVWSFVYFFSLLSSYYILRPIRDEMGGFATASMLLLSAGPLGLQAQIVKDAFSSTETRTAVFYSYRSRCQSTHTVFTNFCDIPPGEGDWFRRHFGINSSVIGIWLHIVGTLSDTAGIDRRPGNEARRQLCHHAPGTRDAMNFIDTVVYRGGDAASSWIFAVFKALGLSLSGIAWIALPVSLVWAWVAYRLGRRQTVLATGLDDNFKGVQDE